MKAGSIGALAHYQLGRVAKNAGLRGKLPQIYIDSSSVNTVLEYYSGQPWEVVKNQDGKKIILVFREVARAYCTDGDDSHEVQRMVSCFVAAAICEEVFRSRNRVLHYLAAIFPKLFRGKYLLRRGNYGSYFGVVYCNHCVAILNHVLEPLRQ